MNKFETITFLEDYLFWLKNAFVEYSLYKPDRCFGSHPKANDYLIYSRNERWVKKFKDEMINVQEQLNILKHEEIDFTP